jgi:hypothetical protein
MGREPARDRLSLDGRCRVFKGADERKERHVSRIPAVHGSVTDTALGIAALPERQTSRRHFVFSPAIGTFEDYHSSTPSCSDYVLSKEDFGLYSAAVRAFKLVDRKVAASRMLFDNSDLYRLAAFWAGIIHEKIKRHGALAQLTKPKAIARRHVLTHRHTCRQPDQDDHDARTQAAEHLLVDEINTLTI